MGGPIGDRRRPVGLGNRGRPTEASKEGIQGGGGGVKVNEAPFHITRWPSAFSSTHNRYPVVMWELGIKEDPFSPFFVALWES